MKKIAVMLLIACLLPMFATSPVNALDNSINNVVVITKDSFAEVFNASNVDNVSYDYYFEIFENDETRANCNLQIELSVKGKEYNILSNGIVSLYSLPNEIYLWEGPLRGVVFINDERYDTIIGFSQCVNTEETMISLTIQKDTTMVALSFGNNILNGEILDFYNERLSHSTNNSSLGDSIINVDVVDETGNNGISPCFIDPNISEVIFDGGGGGTLNLGENGEWVYQSSQYAQHSASSYNALRSRVYFDSSKNVLMVTLKPFSNSTQNYVETLGYDFAGSSLDQFGVELVLEDAPYPNYAYIANITKPNEAIQIDGYFEGTTVSLSPLFEDILGLIGIPTSTISAVLESMNGKINIQESTLFASLDIEKGLLSNYEELDNISTGLPFRFQLSKGNHNLYEGDTPYTVNTYARYYVLVQENVFLSEPAYWHFYINVTTTHEGEVSLG
ncbi:MAG: hypothetical protein IJ360_05150 [Clostridia bacterium]|nr:hypothetical protein [Clostridia bacterium]